MLKSSILIGLLSASLLTIACSPEAGRARGGGPGADVGNRGAAVEVHGQLNPYHQTPALKRSGQ